MSIKKIFWMILGFIGLGMGVVGVIVPLLPAFPFLLIALISFAKSSERLRVWFVNTKLYKNNLESYVQGRGMTRRTKKRIMITVTIMMAVSSAVMMVRGVYWPCLILAGVWVFHILYFVFKVRTIQAERSGS